jgi:hypothetical protein
MGDLRLIYGDLVPAVNGDITVVYDDDAIVQSAINSILTVYDENEFHEHIGNNIFNQRIKVTQSNMGIVENECRFAILQNEGIIEVPSIAAEIIGTSNKCNISFILKTSDNRLLNGSVEINIK